MERTELNTSVNEEMQEEYVSEHVSIIDFKMITFSLAEKDYAIDIMKVKEIAKANNFTYVPNTAPFVLGVYNLRGDIIPIIDLRIFFNIPIKQRAKDTIESMVIINVDDQTFGIVVDRIDKVVGVSKNTIQPPHPIFGDINIKYIYGVVENAGQLYILLDVDRIFAARTVTDAKPVVVEEEAVPAAADTVTKAVVSDVTQSNDALDIRFIGDTLAALGQFYASPVNNAWLEKRYYEWRDMRVASSIQIQSEDQAREFLSNFLSPDTHRFWSDSYMNTVLAALPDNDAKIITVWNVGCDAGYETYSLAVLLKQKYPRSAIRIYANDADLLAISNAPMLTVPEDQVINRFKPYLVKGVNDSYSFNQEIKDMILFEYHDCLHQNTVPDVDIILARDVLSFMKPEKQSILLEEFRDKLKTTGIVILGANEMMPKQSGWMRQLMGDITTFSRE
ncbi:CheR family methyltransferase [Treponema vincentii]|uniref:CheR family methyltransferase n=1 Tax=Treponema vincentii TaxID=69710 RepID=UPI003D8C8D75